MSFWTEVAAIIVGVSVANIIEALTKVAVVVLFGAKGVSE